tara:strand:+ start:823 stop:1830 length:1008 start_codon:yes stop_codon:yes gene_type:complete
MTIKIGINGLGRIGRMVLRSVFEEGHKEIKINHINNKADIETACELIRRDSIHGKFKEKISIDNNNILINNMKISYSQEQELKEIPWRKYDVDYVFECTGKFNSKEKLLDHINNGAQKVIVSAPCKEADKTIVYGVNHQTISNEDKIISAASCTTNCLAPVALVLNNKFGVEKGFMTTIHSFTTDQRLLDNSHKDIRRARSASQSIVPTSTGASKNISQIIPELTNKIEGLALRVPTPNVSLIEFIFLSKNELTSENINNAFIEASKKSLKNILDITNEKLVSSDFNHNTMSSIIDSSLTSVVGKNMGKVSAWYDNEWGFSNRMCDLGKYLKTIK